MAKTSTKPTDPLRIVHCFRSPVGGIFRHVRDLIDQQIAAGHSIGVICDNNTGGVFEENLLAALAPKLSLGLHRLPMDRAITPRDLVVAWKLYRDIKGLKPDVLHSHGAKGGAYARMIGTMLRRGNNRPARLYCPHGGSIHYAAGSLAGRIFFPLERIMERFTDRLIFVSNYERDGYLQKVGEPSCPTSLVYNGLTEPEFEPVDLAEDATDFVFIGMMRDLKGVDLFLDALPRVAATARRNITATLIGDGPDLDRYKARADAFGSSISTRFFDPMPVRSAFAKGRFMVVPSRAESLPYIVLEALAAQKTLLATRVGGIPEIYKDNAAALVEPDSLDALATAMSGALDGTWPFPNPAEMAEMLRKRFSAQAMAESVMDAYRSTLSDRSDN